MKLIKLHYRTETQTINMGRSCSAIDSPYADAEMTYGWPENEYEYSEIYINPESIVYVTKDEKENTIILFNNNKLYIKEKYEDVIKKIEEN